jgi:hypothetical protein
MGESENADSGTGDDDDGGDGKCERNPLKWRELLDWWRNPAYAEQTRVSAYPLCFKLGERGRRELCLDSEYAWAMPFMSRLANPDTVGMDGDYSRMASLHSSGTIFKRIRVSVLGMQGARQRAVANPMESMAQLVLLARKFWVAKTRSVITASGSPDGMPSNLKAVSDRMEFVKAIPIGNLEYGEWVELNWVSRPEDLAFESEDYGRCRALEWCIALVTNACSEPESMEMGKPLVNLWQDRFNMYDFPKNYLFKLAVELVFTNREVPMTSREMSWAWRNSPSAAG